MPLSPLKHPLSEKGLFQATQKLYRETLKKVLPINLLIALIIYFASRELPFISTYQNKIAVGLLVLLLPLFILMITMLDNHAKAKPYTYQTAIKMTLQKFLNVAGALISMLLFPMIVLGLCLLIYFSLIYRHAHVNALFTWRIIAFFVLFSVVFRDLFAPSLVIGENSDPNFAEDQSEALANLKLFRTFIACLLACLIMIFIVQSTEILSFYIPLLKKLDSVGSLIITLIFATFWSWPVAFILVQQYDLQCRKKEKEEKEQLEDKKRKPTYKPLSAIDNDNVSF